MRCFDQGRGRQFPHAARADAGVRSESFFCLQRLSYSLVVASHEYGRLRFERTAHTTKALSSDLRYRTEKVHRLLQGAMATHKKATRYESRLVRSPHRHYRSNFSRLSTFYGKIRVSLSASVLQTDPYYAQQAHRCSFPLARPSSQ